MGVMVVGVALRVQPTITTIPMHPPPTQGYEEDTGLPLDPVPSSRQGWGALYLAQSLKLQGVANSWNMQVCWVGGCGVYMVVRLVVTVIVIVSLVDVVVVAWLFYHAQYTLPAWQSYPHLYP